MAKTIRLRGKGLVSIKETADQYTPKFPVVFGYRRDR